MKINNQKTTKVSHFTLKRPSGWQRPFGGTSASSSQIQELYLGGGKYGTSMVQSIIDIRSSFITGEGLVIKEKQPGSASEELQFIEKNISYNMIDELLFQMTVLTEIEAKLLAVIQPIQDKNIFNINVLPYSEYDYKIIQDEDDLQLIKEIQYKSENGKIETIKFGEFIFRNFGSSLWFKPNQSCPRIASVMESIENLDRASQDLREINHLFANPTPYFKCESQNEVQSLYNVLNSRKWTIGNILVTTADYSLVETDKNSLESLISEMTSLSERISGVTGVPIYFLGLAKQLNNRSTALAMLEQLENSVKKERKIMISWFNELFFNILNKSNEEFGTSYNPEAIECDIIRPAILNVEQETLDKLIELYDKRAISLETLLSHVPQVDNPLKEKELIINDSGANIDEQTI